MDDNYRVQFQSRSGGGFSGPNYYLLLLSGEFYSVINSKVKKVSDQTWLNWINSAVPGTDKEAIMVFIFLS